VTTRAVNLFDAMPADLTREAFDTLLRRDNLRIERIVSRGHSSPQSGWYEQVGGEWVLVLQGAAVIAYDDGEEVRLEAGGYVDIPPNRRHRVKWTEPDIETIWLAVHYGDLVDN